MKLIEHIEPIDGVAFRVAEDQEEIATLELVDEIHEQILLESILEQSKPSQTVSTKIDYLISAPFRYAPLRHGSRFGQRYEDSLFYGSTSQYTALAETAYYRFLFWRAMADKPASSYKTSHTIFQVKYHCPKGMRLQSEFFKSQRLKLTDPSSYSFTHSVGSEMRTLGVEGFEFCSARDIPHGINVAFFNPSPIRSKRPLLKETLSCLSNDETVTFKQKGSFESWTFCADDFSDNGLFQTVIKTT